MGKILHVYTNVCYMFEYCEVVSIKINIVLRLSLLTLLFSISQEVSLSPNMQSIQWLPIPITYLLVQLIGLLGYGG